MAHIDTLKYYDELIAEKVPEKQARIQVRMLDSCLDGLATKDDLLATKDDLNVSLQKLETDLNVGLQKLETDLKKDLKHELGSLCWELKIFVVCTILGTTALILAPTILKHFGW
jgi:hypothetical protein